MTRRPLVAASLCLAACGGGDAPSAAPASRDSAGVAIVEYPADAIEQAAAWQLSTAPLATIGADENDSTIDLSTSMLGTLLPDGGVVVVTAQPAEVIKFDATGKRVGLVGRPGSGPGEYRFVMQLLRFGSDTLFIFDAMSRKGMFFPVAGGAVLGSTDFPVPADRPFPPIIRGRLANGVYIQSGESMIPTPPAGVSGYFRLPLPMFALRPGATAYDTLFVTEGGQAHASSVTIGDSTIAISRQVTFGPMTQIAVARNGIWHSLADRFEIDRRDSTGVVRMVIRMPRPPRPVTEDAKTRFKDALRQGLEQMKGLMPPGLLESELKKIDETVFAENFAAIGQMTVDDTDALWVTSGSTVTDSVTTWAVFANDGTLQGKVVLPEGQLLGARDDRLLIRREDKATGVVRLEVWGLTRTPDSATP